MNVLHLRPWTLARIGLGISFILTSVFIFNDMSSFQALVLPWIESILPIPVETALEITALYDLVQGVWLITGIRPRIASIFAALHIVQVLFVTGINWVTYRDIGLLGLSFGLALDDQSS